MTTTSIIVICVLGFIALCIVSVLYLDVSDRFGKSLDNEQDTWKIPQDNKTPNNSVEKKS